MNSYESKKRIVYTLIFVLLVGFCWLRIDKNLGYIGRSIVQYDNVLPFNIHPVFRYTFEGGFSLEDAQGMSIVSSGTEFVVMGDKNIVKCINRYGFYDNYIIVEVQTTKQSIKYLEILPDSSNVICPKCMLIRETNLYKGTAFPFKWYTVPEDKISMTELFRNILMILAFGGFVELTVNINNANINYQLGNKPTYKK